MNIAEPKVTLIDGYQNPIKTMHAMAWNMRGKMIHDLSQVSMEEALKTLEDFNPSLTKLIGVLEFCQFVFQVENVPRAFTHQLVRHRTCSFSQESLRFTLRNDGTFGYDAGPSVLRNPGVHLLYEEIMGEANEGYNKLIEAGVAPEDARGVLPINTMTKIGFQIDFRTLLGIAEVRECYQSQGHWKPIMRQIKSEIRGKIEGGDVLASWLVCACDRTGRCEFKSTWDRQCPKEDALRNKVCSGCNLFNCSDNGCGGWRVNQCAAMTTFMGK
jgi:flavin-dependent thymidylate synthase